MYIIAEESSEKVKLVVGYIIMDDRYTWTRLVGQL